MPEDLCEGCPKYPPSPSGCTCRVPPGMSYQEWQKEIKEGFENGTETEKEN